MASGDLVMLFEMNKRPKHKSIIIIQATMVLVMIACLFLSCNKESAPDCFQTAGEYTTVARSLDEFSSIELNDYLQIELYDTTSFFVEITAPKNLIPDIETSVNNGKLKIDNKNTCNFVRSFKKKITVRIYAPEFSDIQNKGTGNITGLNTIQCSYFKLENRHAAGVIKVSLHVDSTLIATHTGVSDCYLTGISTRTSLFNQGLGVVDARNLISDYTFVNNSNINDIYVNCNAYLYAALYFSGNIYYTGNPNDIDKEIVGSGELIKIN